MQDELFKGSPFETSPCLFWIYLFPSFNFALRSLTLAIDFFEARAKVLKELRDKSPCVFSSFFPQSFKAFH